MAGLKSSQLAGVWSKNPTFIRYLNRFMDEPADENEMRYGLTKNDLDPAQYIRERCGIESRSELDSNPRANLIFNRDIRIPFMNWVNQLQQEAA